MNIEVFQPNDISDANAKLYDERSQNLWTFYWLHLERAI